MQLITKERWLGDGRTFGTISHPVKQLYVFITNDITDTPPVPVSAIAPGSICIDVSSSTKYFWYNGTWVEWVNSTPSDTSPDSNSEG